MESILGTIPEMNQEQMLLLGMHVVPLYSQLILMKIHALKAPAMVVSRGSVQPNPIFREIRDIIKTLTMLLKDLNLDGSGGVGGVRIPNEKGDLDYYRQLMEDMPGAVNG